MDFLRRGYFSIENNQPSIFISSNLNELEKALTLLQETAHSLNSDCGKSITNHFQKYNIESQANKYLISEVIKMLDQ